MSRPVTVFVPVGSAVVKVCLAGDPGGWLPAPATAASEGWVVALHAGPLTHFALCRVGPSTRAFRELWRPIQWEPCDAAGRARPIDRLLPKMAGELGVMLAPAPMLVFTGSYDPPGAILGTAADRAGLERVAEATARRFVSDIAKRLATKYPLEGKGPVPLLR